MGPHDQVDACAAPCASGTCSQVGGRLCSASTYVRLLFVPSTALVFQELRLIFWPVTLVAQTLLQQHASHAHAHSQMQGAVQKGRVGLFIITSLMLHALVCILNGVRGALRPSCHVLRLVVMATHTNIAVGSEPGPLDRLGGKLELRLCVVVITFCKHEQIPSAIPRPWLSWLHLGQQLFSNPQLATPRRSWWSRP